MSKILWKSLLISPAVLGAALAVSSSAIAAEAGTKADSSQDVVVQASAVVAEQSVATTETVAAESPAPVVVAQAVTPASSLEDNSAVLKQVSQYSREGRSSMGQVTSVSQFTDVNPTDWAFQALQSLVERYGCVVGYPDKTYRGNRAMTRYEFAAGLNACMDRVNELIAAATADLVRKEDLAILQKLQEEFAAELATLRGRVDALEARTATLEKQQFSTTTKLRGEVIFAVTDEWNQPIDNEPVFQDRVRLSLNSSFSGKDLLVTRLAAGNAIQFQERLNVNNTNFGFTAPLTEVTQTFNYGNTGNNQVFADWVAYYAPIGEYGTVYIPAVGGLQYDYAPTLSGFQEDYDGGNGSLTVFGQRNPIYQIGGGSGIGVTVGTDKLFGFTIGGSGLTISAGYLADNNNGAANNPAVKNGLFDGSYAALGQIAWISDSISLGFTYVNAYRRGAIFDTGGGAPTIGTIFANFGGVGGLFGRPSYLNAYGVSGSWKFGTNMSINAFGSYIAADAIGDGFDGSEIWTYGLGFAWTDLGKKGNMLGLTAGVLPYVGNPNQSGYGQAVSNDVPIQLQGFYKFQVNDNISITPGLIYVINVGQNSNNDDAFVGTIRTTFTF